jgi:hypothetical protein
LIARKRGLPVNKRLTFLVAALVLPAALAAVRCGGPKRDAVPWVTIDAGYAPKNAVEEFIKSDAEVRGALPVEIRNYGRDKSVLSRFKGRQFAQPTENVLAMFFKGLDDWMVVDIKYKNDKERDVQRTMLYVLAAGRWTVGDTGTLLK